MLVVVKEAIRGVYGKRMSRRILLPGAIAAIMTANTFAQTVNVQLLNGKTGKPAKKVRVVVRTELRAVEVVTDKSGIAGFGVGLHGSFSITTLFHVDCGGRRVDAPEHTYSVEQIQSLGIVTPNLCGKARAQSTPGTLVYFVRPATVWELLKN